MPQLSQIFAEDGFSSKPKQLDWSDDPQSDESLVGKPVSGLTDLYMADGPVIVNDNGAAAFVSNTDRMNVNFWSGDSMLLAYDPSPETMPDATPLFLSFFSPLREVGAYVSVGDDPNLWGRHLHAIMWVRIHGSTAWTSISANGLVGKVLAADAPATAPFVGAKATGPEGISAVRIDASLIGNRTFSLLALSKLFWVA